MTWYEFEVNLTLKINRGSFGVKYERQGTFRFCAQSQADARAIAGYSVKDAKTSIDVTRIAQVVGVMPVEPDRSDECLYQDHDLCAYRWCRCPHHSEVQFRIEHPSLKSLREIESEVEEAIA